MADRTPLFAQCVRIVAQELQPEIPAPRPTTPPYIVLDLFASECSEVYANVTKMTAFVAEVRPLYLQVLDELSRFEHSLHRALSDADKQALDEQFKMRVQRVYETLKHLQQYERRRAEIAEHTGTLRGFVLAVFAPDVNEPMALYHRTLAAHRMHMLRFLSDTVRAADGAFESMQRQRHARERLLNLLHIQNLDAGDDSVGSMEVPSAQYELEIETSDCRAPPEIPQEQLQELVSENQALLALKASQFEHVEKLHHLMVDIVKLQTELTMHLETQGEKIGTLLDNQDQIDIDLRTGNRTLTQATGRNKRGSNMIIATCIVLGTLLLFVDYVS